MTKLPARSPTPSEADAMWDDEILEMLKKKLEEFQKSGQPKQQS
jgi:hypothetical protein